MATVYSVQKTKWDQDSPKTKIATSEYAGRVRMAYANYELASAGVGTVVEMFNLPNKARILSGELTNDALASSTTISVGHAAYADNSGTAVALDVDEWLAAVSTASIATTSVAVTSALGKNGVVDADDTGIPVTCVVAGATATGTIELVMYYVVD